MPWRLRWTGSGLSTRDILGAGLLGADITVVPRFVSAVASMQPPVTVLLDQAEAVTNRQCLNTIAEFALRLPPGWQLGLASRTAVPLPTARLRAQGGILEVDR